MRFILGVLLGYYMRGKKRLLIITLTVYIGLIIMCSVVIPAIALSMLGLSVMRERASRPPQTSVPVIVGVNYETAQIKLRDANLKIRVLPSGMIHSLNRGLSSLRPLKAASV